MRSRLVFFGASLACAGTLAGQAPAPPLLLIEHVTVLALTGEPEAPDQSVLIRGGRIDRIGPSGSFSAPRGALRLEGRGGVLIPGLWDAHVHQATAPLGPPSDSTRGLASNRRYFADLFLAYGITSVRDMAGMLDSLVVWRAQAANGTVLAPRMLVTGWKLGGEVPVIPGAPYPSTTPEAVRRSVALLKEHGADFVKLETGIDPGMYPVVAEASRAAGLRFLGHVSVRMDPGDAAARGQLTIEHLMGLPVAVSRHRVDLQRTLRRLNQPERLSWWERLWLRLRPPPARVVVKRELAATFDSLAAAALYARFAQYGTAQTPTLVMERRRAGFWPLRAPASAESVLVVPGLGAIPGGKRPRESIEADSLYYDLEQKIVRGMQRAGVTILAGSDVPQAGVPGASLHDELELLVAAGLTPYQALAAATINPARVHGLADSLGTIEPGKIADLVLLSGDPLQDIRHTRDIRAVILRGRVLDRQTLDSLLADATALAVRWRAVAAAQNGAQGRPVR